jgi:hypothetical protein
MGILSGIKKTLFGADNKLYVVGELGSNMGKSFIVTTLKTDGSFKIKVMQPYPDNRIFIFMSIEFSGAGHEIGKYQDAWAHPEVGSEGYTYLNAMNMIATQSENARYETYLLALHALRDKSQIAFGYTRDIINTFN